MTKNTNALTPRQKRIAELEARRKQTPDFDYLYEDEELILRAREGEESAIRKCWERRIDWQEYPVGFGPVRERQRSAIEEDFVQRFNEELCDVSIS